MISNTLQASTGIALYNTNSPTFSSLDFAILYHFPTKHLTISKLRSWSSIITWF
jgi:hypothetical protein